MIIDLSPDWRISTGKLNFELQQRTTIKHGDNAGNDQWSFRGYYSGMDSALRAIPDHLALCDSVTTYKEYLDAWAQLRKEIAEGFRK